jgi:hypothetical protein
MVDMFASSGATQAQWLSNRNFRTPDILLENEAKLDLGGVTARLPGTVAPIQRAMK